MRKNINKNISDMRSLSYSFVTKTRFKRILKIVTERRDYLQNMDCINTLLLLLLYILTANGFLPGGSRTTLRHTHTSHKSTHKIHTLHKMNKLSLEYNNHNYHYTN
jgi:hypothetical protein